MNGEWTKYLLALSACLLTSSVVQAGRVEEIVQLAVHPSDPQVMVLRYEYAGDGLLYTKDGGRTFKLVCGSSVIDPVVDSGTLQKLGPIGVGGDGKVLIGVFSGLFSDDTNGCFWSRSDMVTGRWVTDIVPHPSNGDVTFLVTSNGGDVENGIIRRNSDGSFTDLGAKKAMLINRLRVVELPGGGLRFYESVVLGQIIVTLDGGVMTTKPNYAIRVSDDEGNTWIEHELGILDGPMRLEAVDPMNPDRIVISVSRDRDLTTNTPLPDSVLVSSDQGETFEEWTTVTQFGGITFAPDGRVWLGDGGDSSTPDAPRGIKHAPSLDVEPEVLTSDFPATCVHYTGDDLFVCQRFAFGRLSVEDGTYTKALELSKLESLNECEGVDITATCRQQMCTGYCGTGHFASAPMCQAAYNSTEDRGCAPATAGTGGNGAGGDGTGTGGTGDAGGAGGMGGAAEGGVAGGAAAGGRPAVDAGSMDASDADSSSGGGGCSASAGSRTPISVSFLAVLGLAALRLARRRSMF